LFAAAAILIAFFIRAVLDSFLKRQIPNAKLSWRPFWWRGMAGLFRPFDRPAGFSFVQLFSFAEAQLQLSPVDSETMSMEPGYMFVEKPLHHLVRLVHAPGARAGGRQRAPGHQPPEASEGGSGGAQTD